MSVPLRPELAGLSAYGAPQLDVAVRLNTNENPYPLPDVVQAALGDALAAATRGLNRYPDREATELRTRLASYLGQPFDGVWAANGSNEVIQQLCQAFGGAGRTALGFEPSYSMHELIALTTGTGWVGVPRAEDFTITAETVVAAIEEHRPEIVFLCSPNNPTGNSLDRSIVAAAADVAPGMVVVDEAYAEFSQHPSALGLLPGRERLVVTRTMSKAFGLAGDRIGYLAADPSVVDALRVVRLPYHLSALAQAAACVALDHRDVLRALVAEIVDSRQTLDRELTRRGIRTIPSDANFVLFGRFRDAAAAWQGLLDRGVLIRDVSHTPRLSGWLRVSVGTPEENAAFLAALDQVMSTDTGELA